MLSKRSFWLSIFLVLVLFALVAAANSDPATDPEDSSSAKTKNSEKETTDQPNTDTELDGEDVGKSKIKPDEDTEQDDDGNDGKIITKDDAIAKSKEITKLDNKVKTSKVNQPLDPNGELPTVKDEEKLAERTQKLYENLQTTTTHAARTETLPPPPSGGVYDRDAAVGYASKYWNPKLRMNHDCSRSYHLCTPYAFYGAGCNYPIAHGGNSANFISQCLLAGKHAALNKGDCRGVCYTEPDMGRLSRCLVSHYNWKRSCGYRAALPSALKAGDLIAFHDARGCSSDPVNMAIIVKIENGIAYVTSQDENVSSENYQYFMTKAPYVSYLMYTKATK